MNMTYFLTPLLPFSQTNTTHAVYSNSLVVYPVDGRNDSLSRPVSYPLSCVYPLETESRLDVALRPYLL